MKVVTTSGNRCRGALFRNIDLSREVGTGEGGRKPAENLRKDLRQAEDCFNLAVQKDPNLASPHSNLGNIYAERGWIDRAQTAYEQALVLDPGNPTATHNLGVLYRKSGDIGRGVDLMKQATRSERGRYKSELRSSPETRRIVRTGWIIVLAIGAILLFLLNR